MSRLVRGVAGWAAAAGLSALAGQRVLAPDRSAVAVGFDAFTPVLPLVSTGVLGVAALDRRPALGVLAGGVLAAQLCWLAPRWLPRRAPAPRPGLGAGPSLRVLTANLLAYTTDSSGLARAVAEHHPDVVLLQEYTPTHARQLTQALAGYPYRVENARLDAMGSAIFSRLPLAAARRQVLAGRTGITWALLPLGGRLVRLVSVHTSSPTKPRRVSRWWAEFEALSALVARCEERGEDLVLAGDLNATADHRPFRDLLGAGMRDSHAALGRGQATTWRAGLRWLPALVHLDHVLVSHHVEPLSVRELRPGGSDHRPVLVDLALAARQVGPQ